MQFIVVKNREPLPTSAYDTCVLSEDNWNDWHRYQTMYNVNYFDSRGESKYIGEVKIGDTKSTGRPPLPTTFTQLDHTFLSLGQNGYFYDSLNKLGGDVASTILTALRDMAFDLSIYARVKDLDVVTESIMRSVTATELTGQFHRISQGGALLTPYNFIYKSRNKPVDFDVVPDSQPPTNIHILIGANGAGKTTTLNQMVKCLIQPGQDSSEEHFEFRIIPTPIGFDEKLIDFANVVSVSFSAFDSFSTIVPSEGKTYSYIGINNISTSSEGICRPKTWLELAAEFSKSFSLCCSSREKRQRWLAAVSGLETDPIFRSCGVKDLVLNEHALSSASTSELSSTNAIFDRLSSGHKIALLTITRLVELVEECTLVLFDEPEAHLHPPFLASLIRTISLLLTNRNAVAIIATHSPVILQEVPKSCVWKLRRASLFSEVVEYERPSFETFAENVGVLTHDVFRLEVTESGFYNLLSQQVSATPDFDVVMAKFHDQVGMEGRALTRALVENTG